MASTRRLAAILAADVMGYSRLMSVDEEGTHERLKAHLRDLVEPKIEEHHGRIIKNTGDGMLAEFASVVDAMRCAVEVQRAMIDREPEIPDERRIVFRIGVNIGDVIVEEHDIFGDGVNVAARLEALAEPGGICISRTVRDHIRDKLPYPFHDMGEQVVKNIARPVRVYMLHPEVIASLPTASVQPTTANSPPMVAPRLSIVVLPFANLSNDPDQQYFADGITEDVTTDLSRLAGMMVISRNTAFTYQNKRIDTKQIGRELGVRYVLEGSVRRSGDHIRINAQLIDAETDKHLWADRFDGDTVDLFALQDEMTSRIAFALNLELVAAEVVRPTEHPDALDYILRGRAASYKPNSPEKWTEAISLFERALALDTQSVDARCWLAIMLVNRVLSAMSHSATTDIARADAMARQALAASPRNPRLHLAKGEVLRAQGRPEEAIPEYETVLAFDRNSGWALFGLGHCKLMTGSMDEGISLLEKAIRLSPRDPTIAGFYIRIGTTHLLQSRIDQAIVWLEKARNANPIHSAPHAYLASAYAIKGYNERAAAELAEARRLCGDDRYSSLARLREVGYWGVPKVRALYEATYFVGLREAGMPEG